MHKTITVKIDYAGRTYNIGLRMIPLRLEDGAAVTHFQAVDAFEPTAPLYDLGRRSFVDRVNRAVEAGEITSARAEEILAVTSAGDSLPKRGRRITRLPLRPREPGHLLDELAATADMRGEDYSAKFLKVYNRHHEGDYKQYAEMDTPGFLRLCLEIDTTKFLQELRYRWLLIQEELNERDRCRAVLSDPSSTDADKEAARHVLTKCEHELDARYDTYYRMRREMFATGISGKELLRKINSLRKSKKYAYYKNIVRLLVTDYIDMARYRPYFRAMDLVRQELINQHKLEDDASRALFDFMHRPHDFLIGIVPALHGLAPLFIRCKLFLSGVVAYGCDHTDGDACKSPQTVCDLYGAILGVAETYAERVYQLRAEDGERKDERLGSPVVLPLDENLGTLWHNPRRPVGPTDEEKARPNRDGRFDVLRREPQIDEEALRTVFTEEEAKEVLTYMRRHGLFGHRKARAKDLAKEYRCNRTTIFRWAQKGEKLMQKIARENGIDWDTLIETLSSRQKGS